MKSRFILLFLFLTASVITVCAQSEVTGDTLRHTEDNGQHMSVVPFSTEVKSYDGFLLDMSLLKMTAPTLPSFTLSIPSAGQDFGTLFRLPTNILYTQSHFESFHLTPGFGFSPFGQFSNGGTLQMGSFQLNNGWRINTYGEYDKNGRKVFNPSALPWERNNFKGAFELKSDNGAFGVRIEVHQGYRGIP